MVSYRLHGSIVPKFGNLRGPITSLFDPVAVLPDHVLVHHCLGRRVLQPVIASLADDPTPVCGSSCTSARRPLPRRLSDAHTVTDSEDDDVEVHNSSICSIPYLPIFSLSFRTRLPLYGICSHIMRGSKYVSDCLHPGFRACFEPG